MTNEVPVDFRTELAALNIGTTTSTGWQLFVGNEPSDKARTITLYTFTGSPPNPKFLLDTVNMHIRVRGKNIKDYAATSAKMQEIKDALLGFDPKTIGGTYYTGILMPRDTWFLGYTQDTNQPIWNADFKVWREPASSTASNRIAL